MKLIKTVRIERFRSIKDATINDLGDFTVLAGLNNSGKSNFLRALNLFFNDQIEPDTPIDFRRDHYASEPKSKRRKLIRITVSFDLPSNFKFRNRLESAKKLLGRAFSVTKEWSLDGNEPKHYLNGDRNPLTPEDTENVTAFLDLINFRYIPNRVIPTAVIAREHKALRDVLIRRLARLKSKSNEVFNKLQVTAEALVKNLSSEVKRIAPDISKVRLATPQSLADLAFRFGYKLQEDAAELEEGVQGSGVQSLLMFQTLHLIDRDYFQQFGWRQAAIWAVEEPESSLHTALEAQVARFLATVAKIEHGRLQVLATTHSDLIIQHSDKGYYVEKTKQAYSNAKITAVIPKTTRDLLKLSARFGVSRWVNPILYYPIDPVILLEGKTDRDFVKACLKNLNYDKAGCRVVCLEDLTELPEKGGAETIKRFLKDNADAIRARSSNAPVIVILDWDKKDKVTEFRKVFDDSDPIKVLVWDESKANPKLGKSFRGIERFYPDRIIEEAERINSSLIAAKKNGQKAVSSDEYPLLKNLLAGIVEKGLQPADFIFVTAFINEICQTYGNLAK